MNPRDSRHAVAVSSGAVEAARSFFLNGVCLTVFALPWLAGAGVLSGLAVFAAFHWVFFRLTVWALDRRAGTPFQRRLRLQAFYGALPPFHLKAAAMMAAGLGMLAEIVFSLLSGAGGPFGWNFWAPAMAALCGHCDAVTVRATPPGSLRGVLACALRAGIGEWRSGRTARRGPRGKEDLNGRRKDPENHDLG